MNFLFRTDEAIDLLKCTEDQALALDSTDFRRFHVHENHDIFSHEFLELKVNRQVADDLSR